MHSVGLFYKEMAERFDTRVQSAADRNALRYSHRGPSARGRPAVVKTSSKHSLMSINTLRPHKANRLPGNCTRPLEAESVDKLKPQKQNIKIVAAHQNQKNHKKQQHRSLSTRCTKKAKGFMCSSEPRGHLLTPLPWPMGAVLWGGHSRWGLGSRTKPSPPLAPLEQVPSCQRFALHGNHNSRAYYWVG